MKFEITQDHIDNGLPVVSSSCPIALSIKEKVVGYVGVTPEYVAFMKNGEEEWNASFGCRVEMPANGYNFVRAFDDGDAVEPFVLELEVPKGVVLK